MADDSTPAPAPLVGDDLEAQSKARILNDERYRLEVQRHLSPATHERSPLWTFLNSSFGLWLCTTVFITGAGSAYTYWSQHVERSLANEATIQRLDLEIGYRFYHILTLLQKNKQRDLTIVFDLNLQSVITHSARIPITIDYGEHPQPPDARKQFLEMLQKDVNSLSRRENSQPTTEILLVSSPENRYQPLFPEYAQLGLPSLVAILRDRLSEREQPALDAVLHRLTESVDGDDDQTARRIKRVLMLPRWRQVSSTFFKCSIKRPLCVDPDDFNVPDDIVGIDARPSIQDYCISRSSTQLIECRPIEGQNSGSTDARMRSAPIIDRPPS